jgi:prepilin-type processing-associated H-X9-DG protein
MGGFWDPCAGGNYNYGPRGHSLFTAILNDMEGSVSYNAINFDYPAGSPALPNGVHGGRVNSTALLARVNSFICPSELTQQRPFDVPTVSNNPYGWCSYAGVAGTGDVSRWWFGCPTEIEANGMFGPQWSFNVSRNTDGTSNTVYVGETSRFKGETEQIFNTWTRSLWFGTSVPGVTRVQGIAYTVPKINANLMIPDAPSTISITGWITDWMLDGVSHNFGQFGFRSQHPGGCNFLFGDGSVKFLKQTIDRNAYFSIGTKDSNEVVSADSFL